jgi:phenylacetic acid degradation operon negative regulatory protein
VTFEKLRGLGLEDAAHGFVAQGFDEVLEAQARALWSGKQLVRGYRQARESLERSALRVESLPVEEAAVETFLLGGAAIHLLATDPLLPSEIVATGERGRLADAMLAYDALGRRIWSKLLRDVRVGEAPAHLSLMTGGAG